MDIETHQERGWPHEHVGAVPAGRPRHPTAAGCLADSGHDFLLDSCSELVEGRRTARLKRGSHCLQLPHVRVRVHKPTEWGYGVCLAPLLYQI